MKLEIFDSFMVLNPGKEKHQATGKIQAQAIKNLSFEPTKLISAERRETLNFGQNKPVEEARQTDHLMTPEMQTVVDSLDLHKDHA